MNKTFPLHDVLSATTGRMLNISNGDIDKAMDDLYEVFQHIAGGMILNHQVSKFHEYQTWMVSWFPELAKVDVFLPSLDAALADTLSGGFVPGKAEGVIRGWIDRVKAECNLRDTYEVPQIGD